MKYISLYFTFFNAKFDGFLSIMGVMIGVAFICSLSSISPSVSLAWMMSIVVEMLLLCMKLTFFISWRMSEKSLISRCWDIIAKMSQSPNPSTVLRYWQVLRERFGAMDFKYAMRTSGLNRVQSLG